MLKTTTYLLGIIVTIISGCLLYYHFCCNECCIDKNANTVIPATDAGKNSFKLQGTNIDYQSTGSFIFLKDDLKPVLPVNDNINIGIAKLKTAITASKQKLSITVGLISALLGYLLGRSNSKTRTIVDTSRNDILRLELEKCRKESEILTENINELEFVLSKARTPQNFVANATVDLIPFNADAAFTAFNKKITADDLKIIEGIGPVIEELFHKAGINTWKQWAETPTTKCQEILDQAGDKFDMHNPATWPKQSKLAYEGDWASLKKWQEEFKDAV